MSIRNDFEQHGYLSGINVLPMEKARYYSEKCMAFIDSYKSHPDFSEWTYYRTELVLKWVAELASEESLLDVIEELIGSDILLWNAFLPVKPPRAEGYFGWHQDATYWPVTPTAQIVSAWVALSPVDQYCGGMQMVRGSHLLGAFDHETTYDDSSMLKRGQQITTSIDNAEVFDIDLCPGQASIHHTLTLHRSGPNNSDAWRLGVGLNFASAEVGPLPGYEDSAMPLRGNVEKSGFIFTQPPQSDLDAAALENFAAALQRQSKRYSDVQDK
jgi:ectoine hydroxylase-related dioxygenase (phytanoyl-CoA dioxygenase family)